MTLPMRKFKALDWYHLKGRGDLACVINDEDFKNDGSHHMVDEKVLIDGHVYTVKGVETWCILHIRKGQPIGLLLAEPRRITLTAPAGSKFDGAPNSIGVDLATTFSMRFSNGENDEP